MTCQIGEALGISVRPVGGTGGGRQICGRELCAFCTVESTDVSDASYCLAVTQSIEADHKTAKAHYETSTGC